VSEAHNGSVAPLEVHVDREACRGAGECALRAPQSFRLDDESRSVPRTSVGDPPEILLAAARSCPHFAITVRRGDRVVV
jgi:ferredoxin